jgi:5-methylcytosine-specific restriction endonuclease McrA
MIEGPVLVLNRSFSPVSITSIKRAVCLVFKGMAKIVDEQYQLYDFSSWSELGTAMQGDSIHLTQRAIRVPRVIMLQFYDRLPQRRVRLTRENIYLRDRSTCQYCGRRFSRSDLNLDHIVPISQGGQTTWKNIVCSCIPCNHRKGGRTPEKAGMTLLSRPGEPPYSIFMHVSPQEPLLNAWRIYMNPIDFAYWNLELRKE